MIPASPASLKSESRRSSGTPQSIHFFLPSSLIGRRSDRSLVQLLGVKAKAARHLVHLGGAGQPVSNISVGIEVHSTAKADGETISHRYPSTQAGATLASFHLSASVHHFELCLGRILPCALSLCGRHGITGSFWRDALSTPVAAAPTQRLAGGASRRMIGNSVRLNPL